MKTLIQLRFGPRHPGPSGLVAVDKSRELRSVMLRLRDARLATLGLTDSTIIGSHLVFPSQDGSVPARSGAL